MYSTEQRKIAIEAFIKLDHSYANAVRELGCPNRNSLMNWHMDYFERGEVRERTHGSRFYSDEEKRRAVERFLEYGRKQSFTIEAFGYPCKR